LYSGFNYVLSLTSLLIIALLFLPLGVFAWDFLRNPSCFIIAPGGNVTQIGDDKYLVNITVSYCSSIPLRDVKIRIGNITLEFSELTKGNITRGIVVSRSDIEHPPREAEIEASIAGFYKIGFKYKFEERGG
jgi:subtilase family serine protease